MNVILDYKIADSIHELYSKLNLNTILSENDIIKNIKLINDYVKQHSNMPAESIDNAYTSEIYDYDMEEKHSYNIFVNNIVDTIEKLEKTKNYENATRLILNNFYDNIECFDFVINYYIELINL
jgi:hypothetical protein